MSAAISGSISEREVEQVVRAQLGAVDGVEGALIGRSDGGVVLRIYAVVREHSRDLQAKISDVGDKLLDSLPGMRVDIGVRAHHGSASPESLAAGCRYLALR